MKVPIVIRPAVVVTMAVLLSDACEVCRCPYCEDCPGWPDCGDYRVEGDEHCEPLIDLESTCEDLGYSGGTLSCGDDCRYDVSACNGPETCGNGVAAGDEECDGEDFRWKTCEVFGFQHPFLLRCGEDCRFDTSLCIECGNGIREPPETCDGNDLGRQLCSTGGMSFTGGELLCNADCISFDYSHCSTTCADGILNPGEACDDGNNVPWDGCTDCFPSEFLVNDDGATDDSFTALAAGPEGRFVMAWADVVGTAGEWDIQAWLFDDAGLPVASAFRVNEDPAGKQERPSVGMAADGRFVVTWQEQDDGTGDWSIEGRLFDRDGSLMGDEFRVDLSSVGQNTRHRTVMWPDASFVVSWSDDLYEVNALKFDDTGTPMGDVIDVASDPAWSEGDPSLAVFEDGGFVVAWAAERQEGGEAVAWEIRVRFFGADGSPDSADLWVEASVDGHLSRPAIAAAEDGGALVVWERCFGGWASCHVVSTLVTQDGTDAGGSHVLSDGSFRLSLYPAVARTDPAGYVVTWTKMVDQDYPLSGLTAMLVDAEGAPASPDLEVRMTDGLSMFFPLPAVSAAGDGRFVIAWHVSTWYDSLFAQRFAGDATPLGLTPW